MSVFNRLFPGHAPTSSPVRDVAVAICSMKHDRNRTQVLDLLRMVHFAQVLSAGENGQVILSRPFEASAMGPMHRELYEHLRAELSRPSKPQNVQDARERLGTRTLGMLRRSVAMLHTFSSAQIISFSHDRNGAWAACFRPSAYGSAPISDPNRHRLPKEDVFRGSAISVEALIAEHRARFGKRDAT